MPRIVLPMLDKVDPLEAWKRWEPSAKQPWNFKWAGHLYRRAGFGCSLEDLDLAVKPGFSKTFDLLVRGEPTTPEQEGRLDWIITFKADRVTLADMRSWWLDRMFYTRHPLREKMTLIWHDHFATSV